jgi:hypothetical protein
VRAADLLRPLNASAPRMQKCGAATTYLMQRANSRYGNSAMPSPRGCAMAWLTLPNPRLQRRAKRVRCKQLLGGAAKTVESSRCPAAAALVAPADTDAARQTASRTARTWRIGDAARWGHGLEKSTLPKVLEPNKVAGNRRSGRSRAL